MVFVPAPICPYCGNPSKLVDSATIYQGVSYGWAWQCAPCGAYVGCHGGTRHPLGRLANKRLRVLKKRAHEALDPFWKDALERLAIKTGLPAPRDAKARLRTACYEQLAAALGIDSIDCHIGKFDEDLCLQTIEICQIWAGKKEAA